MEKNSRTFRFTGTQAQTPAIAGLLRAQGFRFEPLPFYQDAMLLLEEPFPLGSSLAAKFGYIYIQDASSMLPALALSGLIQAGKADRSDRAGAARAEWTEGAGYAGGAAGVDAAKAPARELAVLDVCSSPGGKSSLLARVLGGRHGEECTDASALSGFVLANEPGVKRLGTLRRNLQSMNLLNSGTCSYGGESFPLPSASPAAAEHPTFPGWDYILLDPPCSGWGTVEKNPQVLSLWQGDKLKPLVGLQRMLLREAFRLLRPGGCLTYSTCTVNVQENEEQVRWALSELDAEAGGGVISLVPLAQYEGFAFEAPWPSGATDNLQAGKGTDCDGVLRVPMHSPLGQGFFVAALRKGDHAAPLADLKRAGLKKAQTAAKKRGAVNGSRKAGRDSAQEPPEPVFLPHSAIEAPLVSSALLPPGQLALQRGNLSFLPQAGLELLPPGFAWNGYPLGKSTGEGSRPRVDTSARALMPSVEEAGARGADVLDVDEPSVVTALLSGQSLAFPARGAEVGLYFKGLPLCRLKARGGRVFL